MTFGRISLQGSLGEVKIPSNGPYQDELVHYLTEYMKAKHDMI